VSKEARDAAKQAKDNLLWNLGRGRNGQQKFWKYLHKANGHKSICDNFPVYNSCKNPNLSLANAFAESFQSNYVKHDGKVDYMPIRQFTGNLLNNIVINELQVCKLLKLIRINASPGPDKIPPCILINCAIEISPSLTALFNYSETSGTIPEAWKMANIIPIYKNSDKRDCKNYRPISITILISKILDKCISDTLLDHLNHNNLIFQNQHGFLTTAILQYNTYACN
jgi:hypothetical protein